MNKKIGLVDRDIQPIERLQKQTESFIDLTIGGPQPEAELINSLQGTDILFTTSRLTVSERVLEMSDLEIIAKTGTGIDNIDLPAAKKYNIPVTYTPGLNALSVAEHTVALMLAVTHRIPQNQELLQEGGWRNEVSLGCQLSQMTVGIIGFGNIGRRVASLLSGFHVETLAYDPYVRPIDGEFTDTTFTDFESLLQASDIVSVNAALTNETRGLISDNEFDLMKETAIFVNTARGPIVDTDALIKALRSDLIAGAGLDVYETEPLPPTSELHNLESVITTPHAAAMVSEYRKEAIDTLVENVQLILQGGSVDEDFLAV